MAPPHDGAKAGGRSTRSRRGPQQRRRGGGQHPQQQPHPTGSSVDKASLPGSSVASSKKEVVSPTTAISIDSSSVGTPARAVQRVLADAQADALPSSPLSVPQVDTDPVAGRESEKELFRVAEGHGGDRKNVHIASSSGAASTAHEDFNPEDDSVEISKDGPSSQNSSVNGLTIVSNSIEMLPGKSGERGEILADAINSADVTFPTGVRERMSESDVIAGPHDGRKADASSIAHPMTHGIASSESQQQKNGKPVDLSESPLPCPSPIETTVEVSSFSLPSPDSSLLHATTVTDPHVTTHHTSVGMNSGVHTPDSIAPPPPSSAPETTTSMDLSSENTVGLPSSPVITPPPEPHSSWMATNVTPPPVRTSPAETRLGDTSIFHSAPSIEESIASENPKSPPEDDSVPLMASSGSFWTAVSNGSTPQDIASGWIEDKSTDEKKEDLFDSTTPNGNPLPSEDENDKSLSHLMISSGLRSGDACPIPPYSLNDLAPVPSLSSPPAVCTPPFLKGKHDEPQHVNSPPLQPSSSIPPLSSTFPSSNSTPDDAYQIALASIPPAPLSFSPGLRMGRLRNGLEYRILQHPFPAHKIAAHLIVYAGSLHEEDNEQGLAHLLEHCVFQGTRKFPSASKVRKELAALGMSFGGDLNAYTDFHHTAYTLHSPVESQLTFENEEGEDDQEKEEEDETQVQQNLHDRDDENDKISSSSSPSSSSLDKHTKRHQTEQREEGEEVRKKKNKDKKTSSPPLPSNLERCLVLLRELAFAPLLESGEPLEAERHAVLSEEQLRHSVQYRVEKKMFAHFHSQNRLAHRFPIGLTSQVKQFTNQDLRRFQRKWYIPANACVVIVADQEADLMVDLTERIFSSVPDDPSDLSLWGDESDEPEVDETESSHHKDGRPLKEEQEHKEPPQQSTESEEKGGEEGLPVSQGSEKEKKKSIRYLSAEEAWNRRGVIRYQSEEAERKDDGTEEKTSSLLGRGKERSEAPVAWALAGAAIHKPGGVVLPSHPDAYDAPPIREALFQHPLLKGLVVVISGKEELTPWLTTQDLFTTLVDTCISSILQTRLSDGETGRREPLLLSASWNYSNSARENCAWNALTIAAASIKTWREAVDEVLKQIGSLCIYGIEQPELNWILTSLRKCYRDSMSQQECQSGESILEEIVETCLTGCIMTSRKQEYEAYEQLAGKVTSQVIQARAQQVFYHIRHYADQAYKGTKSHPRASLFVYAPTHEPADEDLGLRFLRSSSSSMSFSCANSPSSSLLTTARATSSICSELIPQGSPSSSSPRSSSAHHERRPSRSFSRGNSLPFIPASDEAQEEAADREKDEEEEEKNTLMPSQSHPPLDPASSSSSVLSSSSPTSHLDKTGDSSHPPRMLSSQRKTDEREGSEGGLSSNSKSNHRAGAKEEEKTVEEREGDEKIGGAGEGGTGAEFVLCIDEVSICIKEALENRSIEPEGFHIPDTLLDPEKFEAHVSAHPAILVPPLLRNAVKLHGVSQVDVVQQFASTDGYHDADLDLHCWRFSNGAAINAKQTTFEKNRCQVRLFFMGGESAGVNENERQLLDLGMKTLMDGGIAKHQQKSVDKLCALWGIYISSQVEPEGVTLAVVFDSEQEEALDRVFELIHCYLVHPNWTEDVFQRHKQSMKTAYEMSLSNLDFLSSVALAYQLYPEDRRWVPASSSLLESYTLSQARQAVERQLQPHLLEVCVVGDFKLDDLKTVVKKYIGTLPETLEVTSPLRRQLEEDGVWEGFKPVKSFKKSKFIAPYLEEKQLTERCSITVAFPGFGRYQKGKEGDQESFTESPIYRFRVWRYIEEIVNNRLHDEMREKRQLGYSFSCHTASLEFQDSGVLIFGATPRPAYAAKAWDSLCCVIRDLCTHHPPTREEYHAAKQVLTSGFTTSFKTNDYWLTLLFSLQLPTSPKDLDSIKKIPEFYERISLQDVCDVLRETCFAVPMITCVAISGPKEIKSLLARTETAVEGKVKSYLLSLPHPSPSSSHQMIPWSETPAWPEDLPVDEEWESYTRRQALTRASCLSRWSSPTRWFSELSDFFYGDEDCKKKRKLLLFLGVAVLTGTAVMWMLSSRRRVSRR